MMDDAPRPAPSPDSQPYWDGLRDGKLVLQACGRCGTVRHYPRPVCDRCFSTETTWVEASGVGTIHSWTECHHAFLPTFKGDLPYTLVTVDLAEGVRMNARLRGDNARIGAPVRFVAERQDADWSFPAFTMAAD